jgi:hypothetical protein
LAASRASIPACRCSRPSGASRSGAAASGAAFVGSGADGGSLAMALLTGVALACYAVILFVLGPVHPGRAPSGS